MALVDQPKATRSIDCYPRATMRRWSPYHHRTMWQVDHNWAQVKRQLKANTGPPYLVVKERTKQLGVTHTTVKKTRVAKQYTQDRSTNHEDIPRYMTMATYSDVTNLATPGPKTAKGLCQRYAAVWPNIEAPHTLFAS